MQTAPTELIVVDPRIETELTKNHIEGSKAAMINAAFVPMAEMIRKFELESEEIQKLGITEESIKKARELRLRMVKVRTGTEAIHKEQKAEFLSGGRAVDGIKNILVWAIESEERKMLSVEKHFENLEIERKQKLFTERVYKLKPFIGEEAKLIPLAEMSEDSFNNLVMGYEAAKEQKDAREKAFAEEQAKIEQQRKDEQERIKAENKRLTAFQEKITDRINLVVSLGLIWNAEFQSYLAGHDGINIGMVDIKCETDESFDAIIKKIEPLIVKHREKVKAENERLRKENEQRQNELREQTEKANAERAKIELKLKKEREEKQRLERAEQERIAAEEAEKKRLAAEKRKAAKAPEKERLRAWLSNAKLPSMDGKGMSAEAFFTFGDIGKKFDAFHEWANKQIDAL